MLGGYHAARGGLEKPRNKRKKRFSDALEEQQIKRYGKKRVEGRKNLKPKDWEEGEALPKVEKHARGEMKRGVGNKEIGAFLLKTPKRKKNPKKE